MLQIQGAQNFPLRFQSGKWLVEQSIKASKDPDEPGDVAYKTATDVFKKHEAEIPDKVELHYENPWGLHRITLKVNTSPCPKEAYTEIMVRKFEGWKFWKGEPTDKFIQRAIKRSIELVKKLQHP